MMEQRVGLTADYVIVGSGIAALRAAIGLAGAGRVIALTKAEPAESNTGYAQGGIAAAVGADDSTTLHAQDTLAAGDGLCHAASVDVLVRDGVRDVRALAAWGARFDREASGDFALGREAAHTVRRVLHARDATGREIGRTLWSRLSEIGPPHVLDNAMAIDVLVEHGRCAGVRFLDACDTELEVRASATLLATGGAGQVYRFTTNPPVATGDGIALAYRAGARVTDLEFVQFHPTALQVPGSAPFLLSEALRGEGARLLNAAGETFMTRYEAAGELAPRDRVSRAIVREAQRSGGGVFLSLRHLDAAWVHERFPAISAACRAAGLDLARDLLPVAPAAHYVMGGVVTDLDARTSLPGLFAAGEVACTGVHGANRLASNSLLEGLVFGGRAATAMRQFVERAQAWPASWEGEEVHPGAIPRGPGRLTLAGVRQLMWDKVGLVRSRVELEQALGDLSAPGDGAAAAAREQGPSTGPGHPRCHAEEHANQRLVGWLMARGALRREESRGGHYRDDFPRRDDERWRRHVGDRWLGDSSLEKE
jgi:L-aspartate oxidase